MNHVANTLCTAVLNLPSPMTEPQRETTVNNISKLRKESVSGYLAAGQSSDFNLKLSDLRPVFTNSTIDEIMHE